MFRIQTTPYYGLLADRESEHCPVRQMIVPQGAEVKAGGQQLLDPLGERKSSNRIAKRLVHRYSDRVLFLVTDLCSVYCRYCTRKHFTAGDQAFLKSEEMTEALDYIRSHVGVREVILSGGDPLTLSDGRLDSILGELRLIDHVEIIRIHTRMPVVCPMRVTPDLAQILKAHKPVYLVTHFNHPKELTAQAKEAIDHFVDTGTPVLNQMVLLAGINNHEALVQALSRRLLYLRVKPYYMFQCDPSQGTDHLRTSIDDSLAVQKKLWGHLSGLAMPNYIVDLPNGGGKMAMAPNYQVSASSEKRRYLGWDGVEAEYQNPLTTLKPQNIDNTYLEEWQRIRTAKSTVKSVE